MRRFIVALAAVLMAVPALADEVELTTGEVLKGTVRRKSDVEVVMEHPILGRLEISGANVREVRLEMMTEIEAGELNADDTSALGDVASKPEETKPSKPWKKQIEIGVNGAEGNTDTQNILVGLKATQKTSAHKTKADLRYDRSEEDGVTTKSRLSSGVRRDWLIADSRWLYFGEARYERDQFAAWDQRASLSAGAGYQWIEKEDYSLETRFGASGTKEWGSDDDNHVRPEGLAGVDVDWTISDRSSLTASATYYPDFSDSPEFRLVSSVGVNIRLDDDGGLSLGFGVEHELDSHRVDPFKRQDVRYFAVLLIDF